MTGRGGFQAGREWHGNSVGTGAPLRDDDLLRGGCGAPPDYCFNLYVLNSDGSGLRNLTRSPANESSACPWSPAQKK